MDKFVENEILSYNVSRETLGQLVDFAEIICQWNEKMNLISKNSVKDIWQRHILDSLQLVEYLPANFKHLVDIGSGAGFPAIVLAVVLAEKKPDVKLTLVESITKKTVYLNDVVQRLGLKNVNIINSRVENAVFKDVDVITARAVAATDILLNYQNMIGNSKTLGIYLKGKSYEQELESARKNWNFDCKVSQNKYGQDGVILSVSALRRKK